MNIEILPCDGSTNYLGRMINFSDYTNTEVEHRIAQAWKKFSVHRAELTNRNYSINQRIRLFDGIVTPTALYGSAIWALTKNQDLKLLRTQRRMLRIILGHGRRRIQHHTSTSSNASVQQGRDAEDNDEDDLEPWVDWIVRVTREAEARLTQCKIEDWVVTQRRYKWQWAAHIASMDHDRWSFLAARWNPDSQLSAKRAQGKPKTRWQDNISQFLRQHGSYEEWLYTAADRIYWESMEDAFCQCAGSSE